MALFHVDNLKLHYKTRFGESVHAVDDVSFSLNQGEVLGIAGESGCGKSTLMQGAMGLLLPPLYHTSGDSFLKGESILSRDTEIRRREIMGKQISLIPQGALNSLNPSRKVKDFAYDVVQSHNPKISKKEIWEKLHDRFVQIGIDAGRVLSAYPLELSGGMKQRVVIGISTLMNPRVVIADEPTSALDVSTQKSVMELIFMLLDQGIIESMVFITHELSLLKHVADNIAVMYAGQFVELGSTESVIKESRHPYTRVLMQSMLLAEPGTRGGLPDSIPGTPPKLIYPPKGCRFAQRCPMALPECAGKNQSLREFRRGKVRCDLVKANL